MKIHIFMLIIVISAFSNVAFSAPSSEKHSSLVKRQECMCMYGVVWNQPWCCESKFYKDCLYFCSSLTSIFMLEARKRKPVTQSNKAEAILPIKFEAVFLKVLGRLRVLSILGYARVSDR
ncbi:3157_t:CDS:2 [Funneliformis caledonium]|uniref:3157_t:CDS:1 n=1 Tax=Funneliformis caledonium TaxID=1117310 RepID=A0A9N8WKB1_9GLOM|nr:3157_t:CDS:2 [Funneliformis caledonium]